MSEEALIRVILGDDHRVFLQALRCLVATIPEIKVLGESWSGNETLALVKATKPDLAIVDIDFPDLDGIEITRRIRQDMPATHVLILTAFSDSHHFCEAMEAGASGYVVKDCIWEELECAIRTTAAGERYVSARDARRFAIASNSDAPETILAPRQLQLLRLITDGRNIKEIAAQLSVSVKTAETHRARLMQRLDIHDIAGLVRYAIRHGLQEP